MGVLGLKTILYFAQNHTENAQFLVESMEQTAQLSGAYPFAIACINIANDLIAFLAGRSISLSAYRCAFLLLLLLK
jgi:hypothetical protein